jgi:hypothetical protein
MMTLVRWSEQGQRIRKMVILPPLPPHTLPKDNKLRILRSSSRKSKPRLTSHSQLSWHRYGEVNAGRSWDSWRF